MKWLRLDNSNLINCYEISHIEIVKNSIEGFNNTYSVFIHFTSRKGKELVEYNSYQQAKEHIDKLELILKTKEEY